MAASVTPISYGTTTVLVVVALLAVAGGLAAARQRTLAARLSEDGEGWWARRRAQWIGARALPAEDPARRAAVARLGGRVRGRVRRDGAARRLLARRVGDREADGHGVHQRRRTPPTRSRRTTRGCPARTSTTTTSATWRWRSSSRSSARAPDEGYNLAFALLAALSATAVFTFAGTLWAAARPRLAGVRGGPVLVGVTAVVVCIVLGNLAGAREWLDAADPPGDYDWFAPSRVIPGTINEFPWFSFLLGDLHAHVLALPFTVVALAFALQVALAGPRGDAVLRGVAEALAAGLAVGVLYAINSWSYPRDRRAAGAAPW